MKTIVYQSYRRAHVPNWIEGCMQTVRSWAEANTFEYQLIDDRLFDYVPLWFRQKAGSQICPVTDLARLAVAKEFLAQGYDRTIWIDADIVIFSPELMRITLEKDFSFCHEIWLEPGKNGQPSCSHRVNNSVTVFSKDNVHLDFFIDACLRTTQHKEHIGKLDVGTEFLSKLRNILPFPLLKNVGMLSPAIMTSLASNNEHYPKIYAQHLTEPLACANLCGSLLGQPIPGGKSDDRLYTTVMEKLLQTKGGVINRFFDHNAHRVYPELL
jgi:hypothetical protein